MSVPCFPAYQTSQPYPGASKVSYQGSNYHSNWWTNNAPGVNIVEWTVEGPCSSASVTDLPTNSVVACFPEWSTASPYPGASKVSHKSRNFESKWWTASEPGTGDDWTSQGTCVTKAASSPSPSIVPPGGATVPTISSILVPVPQSSSKPTSSKTKIHATSSIPSVPNPTQAPPPPPSGNQTLPSCYAKWKQQDYQNGSKVSSNGNNFHNKYYANTDPSTSGADGAWVNEGPCDTSSLNFRPYTSPGIIGYWANWAAYTRPQNKLDKLDLSGFSVVNYAFLNALPDGSVKAFDDFADGKHVPELNGVVRNKYPNLRTVISVGGWSGSQHFSAIARSPATIQVFAKNIHAYLDENGFDGVDIDWEHPGGGGLDCNTVDAQDAKNYVDLLKGLRTELGPTRLISIAASADISHYIVNGVNYLPEYAKYLSYFQVMTYDFYGSWSPFSDFNSPLNSPGSSDPQEPKSNSKNGTQFSIASSMKAFQDSGVPVSKLVPGLAFYGRSWKVSKDGNNGLYQSCAGSVNGNACAPIPGDVLDAPFTDPCGASYHSSVWMYNNLRGDSRSSNSQSSAPLQNGPAIASNGWVRQYFGFAENPTLYNPSTQTFIAYDDPQSITAKSKWAKMQGFPGVMVWEIDQDYNNEMLDALRLGFNSK
ncbi:glycoside hydrolase superfamily [Obelidium mucronatum]|nr:glycoside hydrolase superfamily [Obelidium mucronatum]